MAESVKQYLTTVYDIDVNRINVEGRDKPKIPSEQRTGNYQSDLLRDSDDRRVSIESNSPALLMEFQSGSDATQLPMERVQEAPIESYVSFCVDGGTEVLASWSLEVINENNETQKFGPYEVEEMSMPGKSILGERPEGDYKMKMIGQAKNGKIITKETKVHMVLWTPPKAEAGVRHNILFDFNESKVLGSYEKYLTEIVAPLLPKDATVVIRGHADSIGDERHNLTLSMDRANEVMNIIGKALSKANRSDVTFEVYGHGEDQGMSPFQNTFPEERFYNRTVLIDILPSEVKLISYIPGIK